MFKGGISKINETKYLMPPTWEQIDSFIKELGVSRNQFERFYSIPYNTLVQVKSGSRPLPSQYWNIFYEKIKPAYGAGFLHEYNQMATKKIDLPKQKKKPLKTPLNHSRLSAIK